MAAPNHSPYGSNIVIMIIVIRHKCPHHYRDGQTQKEQGNLFGLYPPWKPRSQNNIIRETGKASPVSKEIERSSSPIRTNQQNVINNVEDNKSLTKLETRFNHLGFFTQTS